MLDSKDLFRSDVASEVHLSIGPFADKASTGPAEDAYRNGLAKVPWEGHRGVPKLHLPSLDPSIIPSTSTPVGSTLDVLLLTQPCFATV